MTRRLPIEVITVTGAGILPLLPEIARLRIEVFRAWPYLYDGDMAYEQTYLRTYAEAPHAAVVVALAGGAVAGAATCLPLAAETANVRAPFAQAGWPVQNIFYLAESVLREDFRGQGIGVKFFAAREAQARATGHNITTFCAVQRPEDHPARPPGYVKLDDFWRRRGFTRQDGLSCRMAWKDLGAPAESEKTLVFWTKALAP